MLRRTNLPRRRSRMTAVTGLTALATLVACGSSGHLLVTGQPGPVSSTSTSFPTNTSVGPSQTATTTAVSPTSTAAASSSADCQVAQDHQPSGDPSDMDNPSSDKIVSTDNVSYSQAGGTFLPSGINGPDTTAIAVSTVVGRDRAHSRNAAERGKGIIVRAPGKPAPPDEATRPAPPPPGVGRTVDLQTGRNLRLRITKVIRGNVSAPSCLDIDVPDGVALGHLTDNPS